MRRGATAATLVAFVVGFAFAIAVWLETFGTESECDGFCHDRLWVGIVLAAIFGVVVARFARRPK